MLTQDYLVRMLVDFAAGIMRAMQRRTEDRDPKGAAEMLETAIGESVDMDGDMLLSLAPESIASIMQISGTDPAITEYVARSLMLAASYREDAGETDMAKLRADQARAIAAAYGHDISDMTSAEDIPEADFADAAVKDFLADEE
ncbi:hypothetical protein [Adlercreutzia sp. ZJ304]|uniref:hypothetical protein n=1 Tax=Adlercreutzia sp. ZJ304 TaxID=2709791 RepID=UPI0013EC4443|nr:hypothetical protein [Adlercreutzia sp. ZJ304]